MVAKFLKDTEHVWKKIAEVVFFFAVLGGVFGIIFFGGNAISTVIETSANRYLLPVIAAFGNSVQFPYFNVLVKGLYSGIVLSLGLVISYLSLFYFVFSLLEESNFIARVSHDANFIFRKIGLSGRAALPLLMGYGCTVPAVLSTRAARNEKEKIATGFLALFLPCAARTSTILALIGAFLGPLMALAIYAADAIIVLLVGTFVGKLLGLKPVPGLYEKPQYKIPSLRTATYRAYFELLEFVQFSIPWIIAGSLAVEVLAEAGALETISTFAKPVLEGLFGLPETTFIPLVFGIVRGELTITMLAVVGKTTDFSSLLTARQMLVFTLITIIYIPCLSTVAALMKEFGKRETAVILAANLALTVIIGVLANAALSLFLI